MNIIENAAAIFVKQRRMTQFRMIHSIDNLFRIDNYEILFFQQHKDYSIPSEVIMTAATDNQDFRFFNGIDHALRCVDSPAPQTARLSFQRFRFAPVPRSDYVFNSSILHHQPDFVTLRRERTAAP